MECEAQGIVQGSSENKADYSSQRAMQEYAIAILQELPTIDRKKCGIYSEIAAPVFFRIKLQDLSVWIILTRIYPSFLFSSLLLLGRISSEYLADRSAAFEPDLLNKQKD